MLTAHPSPQSAQLGRSKLTAPPGILGATEHQGLAASVRVQFQYVLVLYTNGKIHGSFVLAVTHPKNIEIKSYLSTMHQLHFSQKK